MKLVLISNFNDETIPDKLLKDNVQSTLAQDMADIWNNHNSGPDGHRWCVVKPDDYVLWRGMEDIV